MRKSPATLCAALALVMTCALAASATGAATRPPDGLYAESSAAVDTAEYSNPPGCPPTTRSKFICRAT